MPIAAALPYIATAASVGSSIYGASQASKAASQQADIQKQALAQQQQIAANLKYTPIDLDKLKADVHAQAVQNATQSLALERSLHPELAQARDALQHQISSELALGGKVSPDIANQVARATRAASSLSGAPAGPLTAAMLGTTSDALRQQRQAAASGLLAANPLPVAGLDPGALASEEVAQNAAMNKFNMAKAGISSNLVQSGADIASTEAANRAAVNSSWFNVGRDVLGSLGKVIPTGGVGGGGSTPYSPDSIGRIPLSNFSYAGAAGPANYVMRKTT